MPQATDAAKPQQFYNGLTHEQESEIHDIGLEILRLTERVAALGGHRSLSLVVTKLDEAKLWLRDRLVRPA